MFNRQVTVTVSKLNRWTLLLLLGLPVMLLLMVSPSLVEASAPAAQTCQSFHVVQRGETLHQIAQRYGTTWPVLAQVNNLADPDQIYAGQRLCIPGPSSNIPVGTVVNCSYLNVRSGPGVNNSVVEVINCGTQVLLLGRTSDSTWLNVRTSSGRTGWVNAAYIRSSAPIASLPVVAGTPAPATGTVTAFYLNARSGPGVNFPIVQVLNQGQTLPVTHRTANGGWVRVILPNGNPAWVNSSYMQLSVPLGTLPVA